MSAESNERRLREIERRLARNTLTPGAWSTGEGCEVVRGGVLICALPAKGPDADAEFIAHARGDVPWLLARVRQLEVALAKLPKNPSRSAMCALVLHALERDPIEEE